MEGKGRTRKGEGVCIVSKYLPLVCVRVVCVCCCVVRSCSVCVVCVADLPHRRASGHDRRVRRRRWRVAPTPKGIEWYACLRCTDCDCVVCVESMGSGLTAIGGGSRWLRSDLGRVTVSPQCSATSQNNQRKMRKSTHTDTSAHSHAQQHGEWRSMKRQKEI